MASPSFFHEFLLFVSLLLMIINPSHSSELNNSSNGIVSVSLYYESLCPYSKSFILKPLMDLYNSDVMSIVNLHLVPYGNAFTSKDGTVSCQHGPLECYYNTIEACALDAWPLKLSFPFITCVESAVPAAYENSDLWGPCCNRLGLDPRIIQNCYTNGHGHALIIRNGQETNGLNPPEKYTPWVLVNNLQIPDVQNLVRYVCNAYKGPVRFKACQGVEVTTSAEKMMSTQAVGLANEGVSP